jgi:hypothetical protein
MLKNLPKTQKRIRQKKEIEIDTNTEKKGSENDNQEKVDVINDGKLD